MQLAIPSLYAIYGRYINQFRAIPGDVDVLKPVERRLLYVLHNTARKKLTKCAAVVGPALIIHPHGDMSTYGTLVALANRGFAIPHGNFGSQGYQQDEKPAAYRYTEIKSSPHIENMAFKYIKNVPYAVLELVEEPLYLPCPVPLGLISSGMYSTITQGISFETTKIPRYQFTDLIIRLVEMLTLGKGKTVIQPHCYGNHVAEDTPGEFESLLTSGVGKIWYCPNIEVKTNYIDIFDARNPETGYSSIKRLHEQYPQNLAVEDLSDERICVRVHSKLGPVTSQFQETIINAASAKVHFKCNVVNSQGQVETRSIDDLIMNSYNAWVLAWTENIKVKLKSQQVRLERLKIIQVIRDCFKPHHRTIDDIVGEFNLNISKYPNVYESDIREVATKGTIKQLIETTIDIGAVQREIKVTENELANINTISITYLKGLMPTGV